MGLSIFIPALRASRTFHGPHFLSLRAHIPRRRRKGFPTRDFPCSRSESQELLIQTLTRESFFLCYRYHQSGHVKLGLKWASFARAGDSRKRRDRRRLRRHHRRPAASTQNNSCTPCIPNNYDTTIISGAYKLPASRCIHVCSSINRVVFCALITPRTHRRFLR